MLRARHCVLVPMCSWSSKSTGSPWFNVFMIVELDRLTERAARDLVEVPSQGERVYWRSDAVQSLLEETGFHPPPAHNTEIKRTGDGPDRKELNNSHDSFSRLSRICYVNA